MSSKGRKLAPGRTLSSLTTPQVRMILRIYYTDQYRRRLIGKSTTIGLRQRLAEQFDVSIEVIKKIISLKHNKPESGIRRQRFKTIALKSIKRDVRRREERRMQQ